MVIRPVLFRSSLPLPLPLPLPVDALGYSSICSIIFKASMTHALLLNLVSCITSKPCFSVFALFLWILFVFCTTVRKVLFFFVDMDHSL